MNNIIIPDIKKANNIIDSICREWADRLHVLADFDKTLTKAFINWEEFPSLIAVLRNDKSILWDEYAQKAHALYDHYSKIEKDPNVNAIKKSEVMTEWWRKHQELLVKSWLTKKHIEMAVKSGYLEFRKWMREFIELLEEKWIPLVIISANGIWTDSIRMFFEKEWFMRKNIHVISNELKFDENWITCGFERRVIHSFNKSETVLEDFPEINECIVSRKNVILLWDSLGDPDMVSWFVANNVLKIGFFNNQPWSDVETESELLQKYKELYDVLLHDDSSLEYISSMIKKII